MPRAHPVVQPPPGWSPPATSYLICTTPRSGSTFLSRLLRAVGAGRPDEHAAEGRNKGARGDGAAAWMTAILSDGLSGNGLFGVKLFPPHHLALRQAGIELAAWLPDLRYIHLRRSDLLGQAISFAIASQTGEWVAGQRVSGSEPRYDRALIARLLDRLVEWENYWRRHFALAGLRPLELVYEEVAAAPDAALAAVGRLLGQPIDTAPTSRPQREARLQRTDRNDAWRQRFLAEVGAAGYRLLDRPQRARPNLASLRAWLAGDLIRPPFGLN